MRARALGRGVGFRVLGLGHSAGVWVWISGLGLGYWSLGFGFRVSSFGVQGVGCWQCSMWCMVESVWCRVWGLQGTSLIRIGPYSSPVPRDIW